MASQNRFQEVKLADDRIFVMNSPPTLGMHAFSKLPALGGGHINVLVKICIDGKESRHKTLMVSSC